MSLSSKKARAQRRAEDILGGPFPAITVDDQHEGVWLMWVYHVAPWEVRVEIQLEPGYGEPCQFPWLYVDGDDDCLDDEASQSIAEMKYRAMTRTRLMEQFADEIRKKRTREQGIKKLEQAATALGLYGKREPRHCIIPEWATI